MDLIRTWHILEIKKTLVHFAKALSSNGCFHQTAKDHRSIPIINIILDLQEGPANVCTAKNQPTPFSFVLNPSPQQAFPSGGEIYKYVQLEPHFAYSVCCLTSANPTDPPFAGSPVHPHWVRKENGGFLRCCLGTPAVAQEGARGGHCWRSAHVPLDLPRELCVGFLQERHLLLGPRPHPVASAGLPPFWADADPASF